MELKNFSGSLRVRLTQDFQTSRCSELRGCWKLPEDSYFWPVSSHASPPLFCAVKWHSRSFEHTFLAAFSRSTIWERLLSCCVSSSSISLPQGRGRGVWITSCRDPKNAVSKDEIEVPGLPFTI